MTDASMRGLAIVLRHERKKSFCFFCAAGPALMRGAGALRLASRLRKPAGLRYAPALVLLRSSGSHLRRLPSLAGEPGLYRSQST